LRACAGSGPGDRGKNPHGNRAAVHPRRAASLRLPPRAPGAAALPARRATTAPRRPRGILAVLMLAAPSACERTDGFDLHPDVVALAVLLVGGESEARMLAVHPHRQPGGGAPEISATLEGPGWEAAFSRPLELEACGGMLPGPFPSVCLGAMPPESIRPDGRYGLRGTTALGSFTGEMTFPTFPRLVEPADTLRLSGRDIRDGRISIPIGYQVASDVGALVAEVHDFVAIGPGGVENRRRDSYWVVDRGRTEGWVWVYTYDNPPMRFSLRLLAIGWHYADFLRHTDIGHLLIRPWPRFGIKGEGVYGYFDGVTPSRAARVLVDPH